MDPITTAIVTALSAGAEALQTQSRQQAVTDSYSKLKGLLTKKHGASSDVVQAITQLETKPESQGRDDYCASREALATGQSWVVTDSR